MLGDPEEHACSTSWLHEEKKKGTVVLRAGWEGKGGRRKAPQCFEERLQWSVNPSGATEGRSDWAAYNDVRKMMCNAIQTERLFKNALIWLTGTPPV